MSNAILILQARAARELGIPWEVFDSLTPSELAAISSEAKQEWISEQKVADARTARLIAAIYRAAGAKDVKEENFMPDYKEKPEPIKPQTNEQMTRILKAMAKMMG